MIFEKPSAKNVLKEIHGTAISENDIHLKHYGVGHLHGGHSGRWPWGSGENPYQHYQDFLTRRNKLKEQGMSEKDIATAMGFVGPRGEGSTEALRNWGYAFRAESDYYVVTESHRMAEQGKSAKDIAAALGVSEPNVRSYLKADRLAKAEATKALVDYLRDQVDNKGVVEIGAETEKHLNVTRTKFDTALYLLKEEGYEIIGGRVKQGVNAGKQTTVTVLAKPGTPKSVVYRDIDKIKPLDDTVFRQSENGEDFASKLWSYPESLDSSRVMIRYPDEGGADKDGLVEIRRGVKDLTLGDNAYAQVRIMVDGTHYIKGMAAYTDDPLPPGIDIVVNTSKRRDEKVFGRVFKECKEDPDNPGHIDKDNPFGALLREERGQIYYEGDDGKQHLSPINITREAGDWDEWNRELPSQFLSKQPEELISRQLSLSIANASAEFAEIMSLTNPIIKKHYLQEFASSCDRAAVDLAGAPLPGQKYQVLLPAPSLKDNEVYAPNYEEGTRVALVRFPHAGPYEIPILTVTHKNEEARNRIGANAKDAICINKHNLDLLSGADTDGDTAMVLPCNYPGSKVHIITSAERGTLKGLEGFDPHVEYATDDKFPKERLMKWEEKIIGNDGKEHIKIHDRTQREMGIITNLITDMTLHGAEDEDLAAATRHSMVVIDAGKHKLDYKRSEKDNHIKELKKKYQTRIDLVTGEEKVGGASTILSRAKSQTHPIKAKGAPRVDPNTGNLVYIPDSRATYIGKDGKVHTNTRVSNQMMDTQDASILSSGEAKEQYYVDYANTMKQFARDARLADLNTPNLHLDRQAQIVYSAEAASLHEKVEHARQNSPKERLAQLYTSSVINAKTAAAERNGIELSKKDLGKLAQKTLIRMRNRFGASRDELEITDKEWEAMQAGAISVKDFNDILRFTDEKKLRERAMPKTNRMELGSAKQAQIRAWAAAGYTNADIAKLLGISISTVIKYLPK